MNWLIHVNEVRQVHDQEVKKVFYEIDIEAQNTHNAFKVTCTYLFDQNDMPLSKGSKVNVMPLHSFKDFQHNTWNPNANAVDFFHHCQLDSRLLGVLKKYRTYLIPNPTHTFNPPLAV
jgi:hypothetical protein